MTVEETLYVKIIMAGPSINIDELKVSRNGVSHPARKANILPYQDPVTVSQPSARYFAGFAHHLHYFQTLSTSKLHQHYRCRSHLLCLE